jgi:hypothetical protein
MDFFRFFHLFKPQEKAQGIPQWTPARDIFNKTAKPFQKKPNSSSILMRGKFVRIIPLFTTDGVSTESFIATFLLLNSGKYVKLFWARNGSYE